MSPSSLNSAKRVIPGTTPFDGEQARKGYALNKMCYSFNSAANRQEFIQDEDAYCRKYGLSEQQRLSHPDLQHCGRSDVDAERAVAR